MAEVATSAANAGADALLFAGAGSILTGLGKLALELYASREMCEDLIKELKDLEPQLASMLAKGHTKVTSNAIAQFHKLVVDVEAFLNDHLASGKVARLVKHWKVKDRIKDFHAQRARIVALMQLEFIDESADNHVKLRHMVQSIADGNDRIEQQHQQGLTVMKQMIDEIPTSTATLLEDRGLTVVALADLKNEIKVNASAYTDPELAMMKKLFLAGCEAFKIPRESLSLPVWYISRSDVRFDKGNPFATGQFHSLHYATLDSGARVAVNIVNAEMEDVKARDRFVKEVNTLSMLRDPHILPFFGANHVGSPLMYVTAIASNGDFLSYMSKLPHHFWQLFLDAARGLAYLHKNKLVHGNLKCRNLLVLADGTGVVSDFMFAFVRASSVLSLKTKPTTYDWTAPECLGVGVDANPRFESDIYSLGLCLIEAVTNKRPFEGFSDNDDATRDMIRDGKLPDWSSRYEIPESVTDLVTKMCARDYHDRPKLGDVIRILEVLAAQERDVRELSVCVCESALCRECGKSTRGRLVLPQSRKDHGITATETEIPSAA